MGCNCRKAKKIHDVLTKNESSNVSKNIFGLSWGSAQNYFSRTLQGLLIFIIIMVIFPFIMIYLLITYIISGSYSLYIPNFLSKRMQ